MKVNKDIRVSNVTNRIILGLLQSGNGECGDRIAIMKHIEGTGCERNLGGWCIESAQNVVSGVLRDALKSKKKKETAR